MPEGDEGPQRAASKVRVLGVGSRGYGVLDMQFSSARVEGSHRQSFSACIWSL